jgi:hypothetical protein
VLFVDLDQLCPGLVPSRHRRASLLNRLIQACEPVDSLTHLTGQCIFDSARSNNTRLHLSGMLGVDSCHFFWVLEGCAHI